MKKLRLLIAVSILYRANFQNLHWNAAGENFDRVHSIAEDYYDLLSKNIDILAEMQLRLEGKVPNLKEAIDAVSDADKDFLIIESEKLFDKKDFFISCDTMFEDLLKLIEDVLEEDDMKKISNVGIKATLEGIHEEFDLQYRYINKRRINDTDSSSKDDDDDDEDTKDKDSSKDDEDNYDLKDSKDDEEDKDKSDEE